MNKSFPLYLMLLLVCGVTFPVSAFAGAGCACPSGCAVTQRPGSQKKDWHDGWRNVQQDDSEKPQQASCHRERFIRELSAYLTREAGLTADEAQKFFPVFFELREKQHSLDRQKARALRLAADRNQSEAECARVLDELERFNKKALRIETTYMERLEKLIGAQKLVKVLRADRKFGRRMFHERRGNKAKRATPRTAPQTKKAKA